MDIHRLVDECTGFDWDEYNIHKNWDKHQVPWWECEEVFLNEPVLLLEDIRHSEKETRYYALGTNADGRKLSIVFTVRGHKIRSISARDMSRKERQLYGKSQAEADPQV